MNQFPIIVDKYLFFDETSGQTKDSSKVHIEEDNDTEKEPNFNVVLLDDNDHTYDYVVEMLMKLFEYTRQRAFLMACEVDYKGRVVVFTNSKKIAEEKRDQILSYGADWRLDRSKGSMSAVVEPV